MEAADLLLHLNRLEVGLELDGLYSFLLRENRFGELFGPFPDGLGEEGKDVSGQKVFRLLHLAQALGQGQGFQSVELLGTVGEDLLQLLEGLPFQLLGLGQGLGGGGGWGRLGFLHLRAGGAHLVGDHAFHLLERFTEILEASWSKRFLAASSRTSMLLGVGLEVAGVACCMRPLGGFLSVLESMDSSMIHFLLELDGLHEEALLFTGDFESGT